MPTVITYAPTTVAIVSFRLLAQARSAGRQLTSESTLIFRRRRLGSWIPLRGWTNMHTILYTILGTRVRLESRQTLPGVMYPFAALATLDWTCALDVLPLCVFQESLCSDIVKVCPRRRLALIHSVTC